MTKSKITEKVNLRNTDRIMSQLEDTLDSILLGSSPIDVADIRIRCCKHAIQIIALSHSASKSNKNTNIKKLPHIGIE